MRSIVQGFCRVLPVLALLAGSLFPGRAVSAAGSWENAAIETADLGAASEIVINASEYTDASEGVARLEAYYGQDGVLTPDTGYVEWSIQVPRDGAYQIGVSYCPYEGKSADAERQLWLDGEPVMGNGSFLLSRIWKDYGVISRDNRGNDLCPEQIEVPQWRFQLVRDTQNMQTQPLTVRLTAGEHRLRLVSLREPAVISSVSLLPPASTQTYAGYRAQYADALPAEAEPIYLDAETPDRKSSPVLTPSSDRSSPLTEPQDPAKVRLNILDGAKWCVNGQWVEYDFTVEKAGLYQISFRWRQNDARGLFGTRAFYIDDELPFQEMAAVEFPYTSAWKISSLSVADGDCWFYLDAGEHTLCIEAVVGSISDLYAEVYESVQRLNVLYREIVMITGTQPDIYRDYELNKLLPEVVAQLGEEAAVLEKASQTMTAEIGRSSYTSILDTAAYQLREMHAKPHKIPEKLSGLNSYIASLGTWLLNVKNNPLDMDFIVIAPQRQEDRRAEAGFFSRLLFEIRAFAASFIEDYSVVGSSVNAETTIEIWMNSGRDQAQILKSMIESDFTPRSGIGVEVKVVQGALLQATVAGIGPDVALTVGQGDPVNYALRGAAYDLSRFEDSDGVLERFYEAAVTPLRLNGSVYALPETMTFPMLFYRIDILEELGIAVPQTWEEMYSLLPVLQRRHMNFGIPTSNPTTNASVAMTTFGMFLYQNGGAFYTDDGRESMLGTDIAVNTMRQWTELYTNYRLDDVYDFASRFRSGEMPIGIAEYTTYNVLTAFAPEIRNQWTFTTVPGTVRDDGTLDKTVPSSIAASMILGATDKPREAWEFLKWWTSDTVQTTFGRRLETLLGETGRYPSANKAAMERMPWTVGEIKELSEQLQSVRGIPEVAGGYFTWRHLDNAFRAVLNDGADPRDTMLEYYRVINQEIRIKREEFNLDG